MASRFSDIFSSENSDQDASSDTNIDQNADANADASNDGVMFETESYSRNEDGEEQYDRTSLDTGNTDLGGDLDVDSMVDNLTDLSSSTSDLDILDS